MSSQANETAVAAAAAESRRQDAQAQAQWLATYSQTHPEATSQETADAWLRYRTDEYLKHDPAEIDRRVTQKINEAHAQDLVEAFDSVSLNNVTHCHCSTCRNPRPDIERIAVEPKDGKKNAGIRIIHGLNLLRNSKKPLASHHVVQDPGDASLWKADSIVERVKECEQEEKQEKSDAATADALKQLTEKHRKKRDDSKTKAAPMDISVADLLDVRHPVIKYAKRRAPKVAAL